MNRDLLCIREAASGDVSEGAVSDADINRYAEEIGLDMAQFGEDMADEAIEKRIRDKRLSGLRSGVNGTPTFFINGVRYEAPPTHEWLSAAVEHFAEHHHEQ